MAMICRHIDVDYSVAQIPTANLKGLRVYQAERCHAARSRSCAVHQRKILKG